MQSIYPILRYNEAREASRWLCAAFGFSEVFSVPESGPYVRHAQLRLGTNLIMLGSLRPEENMAAATQALYVYVEDLDAHFERARAAGAEILETPAETGFGGRQYSAKDPEGHHWAFGSYLPQSILDADRA